MNMNYGDCPCLNWKEILSLIDDYYQVILFLYTNNTLISENNILPKLLYYYLIRYDIRRIGVSGRRGRTTTEIRISHSNELARWRTRAVYEEILASKVQYTKLAELILRACICIHVTNAIEGGTQPCGAFDAWHLNLIVDYMHAWRHRCMCGCWPKTNAGPWHFIHASTWRPI